MAGTNKRPIAVSDAGPLIHLDELESLELLSDFEVRVSDRVWREAELHRPKVFQLTNHFLIRCPGLIEFRPQLESLGIALSLDPGEMEALSLMESIPSAIFLTDDAAARLAAQAMGYRVHGTIGILLRAIRQSRFSNLEVIERLLAIPQKSSLHIRPSLLNEIIGRLQQED